MKNSPAITWAPVGCGGALVSTAHRLLECPCLLDENVEPASLDQQLYPKVRRVDFIDAIPKSASGKILLDA